MSCSRADEHRAVAEAVREQGVVERGGGGDIDVVAFELVLRSAQSCTGPPARRAGPLRLVASTPPSIPFTINGENTDDTDRIHRRDHRRAARHRATRGCRIPDHTQPQLRALLRACAGEHNVPEAISSNVFYAHHYPDDGRTYRDFPVTLATQAQCRAALESLPRLEAAAVAFVSRQQESNPTGRRAP